MMRYIFFAAFLIYSFIFSQGTFTVKTDKDHYDYGESITVTASLINDTDSTFSFTGSSSCICLLKMENVHFLYICTTDNFDFVFYPGDSRSWVWYFDPETTGLPKANGYQNVTATCSDRVAQYTFYAPKYYGGNISVLYYLDIPENTIRALQDSLNVTVIKSDTLEPLQKIYEVWNIVGLDIDSVASEYQNDPRFDYMDASIFGNFTESSYLPIEEEERIPNNFVLQQNYPNPFNPSTTITYRLGKSREISLKVYDTSGKLVRTLIRGRQNPGIHSVIFDGSKLASGTYICRLSSVGDGQNIKMLLLK